MNKGLKLEATKKNKKGSLCGAIRHMNFNVTLTSTSTKTQTRNLLLCSNRQFTASVEAFTGAYEGHRRVRAVTSLSARSCSQCGAGGSQPAAPPPSHESPMTIFVWLETTGCHTEV